MLVRLHGALVSNKQGNKYHLIALYSTCVVRRLALSPYYETYVTRT